MSSAANYDEYISLPRAVRFPVELVPPTGFNQERVETWPRISGRLEWVDGRLLYMPPCGDVQQDTVTDVVITLGAWIRSRAEFVLGTSEAGMRLVGATRAADAAIWRKRDLGAYSGGLRRVPPVLAVEVASVDEPEEVLREKARWYLGAGVQVIWLVLPERQEVVVLTLAGEVRCRAPDRLPEHAPLLGLAPSVSEIFTQIRG